MGGIEEGEDAIAAAKREIEEETGYKNVKFIDNFGDAQSEFFAAHKDVNRIAHTRNVLFELTNEEHSDLSKEESDIHELVWMSLDEIKNTKMTHSEMPLILRGLEQKKGAFIDEGIVINSGEFDYINSSDARTSIAEKFGEKVVRYKLRDWVFSRQRYWGEPIPVIHCEKCGVVPVPEKDLPVRLPEVEHYEPTGTGESPLANITEWVNVACPKCGGKGKRETNTMPQWAGSSWYYLRYTDPKNDRELVSKDRENYWMRDGGVDVYVGGAEHATRHLIYARFWHKFLFDLGVVSTIEPFMELHSVGLVLAEDGRKMSKRYGNV
jgi:leucyl-tRNA synthetase